jgi:uncharacterized membrane protein YeaQ/YmgE (transglycosylase-associated protein family)
MPAQLGPRTSGSPPARSSPAISEVPLWGRRGLEPPQTSLRLAAATIRKKDSMGLLWFVIIGAIAGWLAGQFMKGSGFGLLGDIIVGVIGAFLGGYLFRVLGLHIGGGLIGSLIVAFIGAVVLLFIVRLFTSRRSGRRSW